MEPVQCGGRSTQILPTSVLDRHYILQSVTNYPTKANTTIGITTSKDHTDVLVNLSTGNNNVSTISFDNLTYHAGEIIHDQLDSFQIMWLKCQSEIFRIDIKSSDPIAVFYGQDGGVGRQLLPVSRWGKHFISFPISETADTIQITGNTQLHYYCT